MSCAPHQPVVGIDSLPASHLQVSCSEEWIKAPFIHPSIRSIYAMFGNVILLDYDEQDVPADYKATLNQEYQKKLTEADRLAVRVGGNHFLRCVVFSSKADISAWLDLNPTIRPTLITAQEDASKWYLWLFLRSGRHIRDENVGGTSWLGTPANIELRKKGEAPLMAVEIHWPKIVDFNDLCWDSHPRLKFRFTYNSLLTKYGEPVQENQAGKLRINTHFWAGVAIRELGVRYDSVADGFLVLNPAGEGSRPVSDQWVLAQLCALLLSQGRQDGCLALMEFREPRTLKDILEAVKTNGVIERNGGHLTVDTHVRMSLVREKGSTVSSAELLQDYQRACERSGSPALSERQFYRDAKEAIHTVFSICKNNSVERPGGAKNGYKGLRLKLTES